MPDDKELITPADRVMLRRRLFAMKRHGLPPIVTHNMVNDAEDPVLNQLRRVQLFNHSSDRVKVIFHPEFLNSANPVLSLDYDDFVRGTHLGVFASYYEPWGYTPGECVVMGVPSVTTNLSGFGCYMEVSFQGSGVPKSKKGLTSGRSSLRIVRTTESTLWTDETKVWMIQSINSRTLCLILRRRADGNELISEIEPSGSAICWIGNAWGWSISRHGNWPCAVHTPNRSLRTRSLTISLEELRQRFQDHSLFQDHPETVLA